MNARSINRSQARQAARQACIQMNTPPRPQPRAAAAAIADDSWFHQPAVGAAAPVAEELAAEATAAPLLAQQLPFAGDDIPAAQAYEETPVPGLMERAPADLPIDGYYEMPVPAFDSLDDFLASNPSHGQLTVLVLTPDAGVPIPGAHTQVTKLIGDTTYLYYDALTDENGSVGPATLPAPPRELSFDENAIPYAQYDITVTHGSDRQDLLNVTIFPDTTAVQVVRLDHSPPINEAIYTR